MERMLSDYNGGARHATAAEEGAGVSAPLLVVLWRRRWVLLASVVGCLAIAGLYLAVATPVFSSTASVFVEQYGPRVFGVNEGVSPPSDNYLQTQVNVFLSAPVLSRALEAVHYKSMKTFAGVRGDPVASLQRGGALKVEAAKRSDVILVSMESPYPAEAAALVNGVVESYVVEQAERRRSTGKEMVAALEQEMQEVQARRDAALQAMIGGKRSSGILSFRDERGNTVQGRAVALSEALTAAQIRTMELRARQEATKAAMSSPGSVAAFLESQRALNNRELGDREYDDLRAQLVQYRLALSGSLSTQGPNNPRVQGLKDAIESLQKQLAAKEQLIAEAQLAAVSTELTAAEQKERQLRAALQSQWAQVLGLDPATVADAKLEADASRMQKQSDLLESRVAEVSTDRILAPPMNVAVLQRAQPGDRPVKPNKTLVMAAALSLGWVLGIGLSLVREWQDARLRTPDEIRTILGTPVIGTVPRINGRLSAMARGQLVYLDARSPAAEAFRCIRTSLQLGGADGLKTVLVASPAPGDGKSTTAANLAIAFAQGGSRTLLVDCDLREPVQHLIFQSDGKMGLTSLMSGEAKIAEAVSPTRVEGLYLLPAGPVPLNPSELLASERFRRLMEVLAKTFDRVVIDSPPLTSVTDGCILAAAADVTVLVLRMNQSAGKLGIEAMEGLEKVGANVLGVVANEVRESRRYRYYGGSWQYAAPPRRAGSSPADRAASVHAAKILETLNSDWSEPGLTIDALPAAGALRPGGPPQSQERQ